MVELVERLIEEAEIVLDSNLIVYDEYNDGEMASMNGFSKMGLILHMKNRLLDIAEAYLKELYEKP